MGLLSFNGASQSVNDYKYVIVPDHYDWAKEIDKYQLNSLTTFLFKKYGFDAYQSIDSLPDDININGCNSLTADVEEKSNFLRTKLKVVLKNCKGEIVFTSQDGMSKLKQYKPAYHAALRSAFQSIKELKYVYSSVQVSTVKEDKKQPLTSAEVTDKKPEPVEEEPKVITETVQEKPVTPIVDKKPKPVLAASSNEEAIEVDHYKSTDGTYSLDIGVGSMIFYEGSKVIGEITPKAAAFYQIVTSEFSGKGYFQNDQFVIEREIKGVQGIVKMIFEKE